MSAIPLQSKSDITSPAAAKFQYFSLLILLLPHKQPDDGDRIVIIIMWCSRELITAQFKATIQVYFGFGRTRRVPSRKGEMEKNNNNVARCVGHLQPNVTTIMLKKKFCLFLILLVSYENFELYFFKSKPYYWRNHQRD